MTSSPVPSLQAVAVVAISFSINAIVAAVSCTMPGIFYVDLLHAFPKHSSAAVATAMALVSAATWGIGPVASLLTNRFGCRKVAMLGGLLAALGLVLSTFATSIYHIYVTFGVLLGIGTGIAFVPSITIIGRFFDKQRTIAMGIAVSGYGFGNFAFPPMLRYFIDEYGWRGAFLLSAGVCLHMTLCGAFIGLIDFDGDNGRKPSGKQKCAETPAMEKYLESKGEIYKDYSKENGYNKENELLNNMDQTENGVNNMNNMNTSQGVNTDCTNSTRDKIMKEKSTKTDWTTLLNLHVFKSTSYILLCINNVLILFGLGIIYVHLAAYTMGLGFSGEQAAVLYSTIGIANIVGRISFGLFAHAPCVSAVSLYTVSHFAVGAITQLSAYIVTYPMLIAYGVLFGFLSGSLGALLPIVLVDILGVDMLTSGYGYVLIFDAIGNFLGPPTAGWVYDQTHNYKTSLYLGGAAFMLSSFLMTYQWFCDKPHLRHRKEDEVVMTVMVQPEEKEALNDCSGKNDSAC